MVTKDITLYLIRKFIAMQLYAITCRLYETSFKLQFVIYTFIPHSNAYRDPDYHRRKTMAEIYSLLARIDEQSVEMSEADKGIFPEAATLGAPLPQGSRLYPDLQNVYLNA